MTYLPENIVKIPITIRKTTLAQVKPPSPSIALKAPTLANADDGSNTNHKLTNDFIEFKPQLIPFLKDDANEYPITNSINVATAQGPQTKNHKIEMTTIHVPAVSFSRPNRPRPRPMHTKRIVK